MPLYFNQAFYTGSFLAFTLLLVNLLPSHGIVFPEIMNSGHALVFLLANLFLLKLLIGTHKTGNTKNIIFISAFSVVIGLTIELIQPYFGRNRSFLDFLYDVLGVIFSILIFTRLQGTQSKAPVGLLLIFFSLALAFPAFKTFLWWQINLSPIILNFERSLESLTYTLDKGVHLEISQHQGTSHQSQYIGKVTFGTEQNYPGINLDYPKQDWRNYQALSWEVLSLNETPVFFNLRVHDTAHDHTYTDRFNYAFEVLPGYNLFEVALSEIENSPSTRKMDMANIRNIKFFIAKPSKQTSLYLDNVYLK